MSGDGLRDTCCPDLWTRINELQAENERLREEAPDYERLKRAEALADSEYVGQAWKPLWQWAWEQTALEGGDG